MPPSKRLRLYPVTLSGGFAALAVELSASRLIGPAFGTSNSVWAAIIGLLLLYLSLGYYIGGLLGNQLRVGIRFIYAIALISALAIGAIPAAAPTIIGLCLNLRAGAWLGAFLSTAILFGPSTIMLGCISPLAVQVGVADLGDSGRVAGKLYAISTAGSLIGAFLPVLWWLPEWGTTRTFLAIAIIQVIVGVIGLGYDMLPHLGMHRSERRSNADER